MKTAKKITAFLLCLLMILSVFSGCGETTPPETTGGNKTTTPKDNNSDETKDPDELEHLEISIAYFNLESDLQYSVNSAGVEDAIWATIEDKFNVTLVPKSLTWDDCTTKTLMWAATDSLPDFFVNRIHGTTQYREWAEEGIIAALPQDLSNYPNLENHLATVAYNDNCMIDGSYYCIPRASASDKYRGEESTVIVYRSDWAEAAGITKEPETMDELVDMLQKMVDSKPEGRNIRGMSVGSLDTLCDWAIPYSDHRATVNGNTFKWIEQDGTYVPAYFGGETLGSNMIPTWNLLRELYTTGLLNPDIALANDASASAAFYNDEYAAFLTSFSWMGDACYNWRNIKGTELGDSCKVMQVIPSTDGKYYLHEYEPMTDIEFMFNADIEEAKMERILMIWEYLMTDEGIALGRFGIGLTNGAIDMCYVDEETGCAVWNEAGGAAWYSSQNLLGSCWSSEPMTSVCKDYFNSGVGQWWYDQRDAFNAMVKEQAADPLPVVNECTATFLGLGHKFGLHITDDAIMIMTSEKPVEEIWAQIIEEYKSVDDLEGAIAALNEAMK